ncbi:MAG: hypothetical protein HZA53_07685 [Planctomycetes bacterium]|nr:hypothetical protein [Planctomycetota bacterium]
MELQSNVKTQNPIVRQLASLKVLSRLLGHELHAQGASKAITLSRDEVVEVQTTVDLFIEEITRRVQTRGDTQPAPAEPQMVAARN